MRPNTSLTCLVLFCILFMISSSKKSDVQCPKNCKCSPSKKKAMCSVSVPKNQQYRYIPKLPEYVTWFYFTGNNLPRVTRASLVNLTYNKITRLALQASKIRFIAPDAFEDLPYLTHLEMNQHPHVSPKMVSKFLPSLNKSLITKLYFKDNHWKNLPMDIFKGLSESNLITLSLERNEFSNVDGQIFLNLSNLQSISFRSNRLLSAISLKGIPPSLVKLDLSDANLLDVPDFCDGNKTLLPSIIFINLQKNHIRNINADSFKCLGHLKELNLDENNIHVLRNNTLKFLTSIERLSIREQHGFLKRIRKAAFNSSTLRKLTIADNRLEIGQPAIFKWTPNLTFVNIQNNHLSMDAGSITRMFRPLKKLQKLILQSVDLRILPRNLFPNLPVLNSLILTSNNIPGWNNDPAVFGNMTSLRRLILTDNKIKLINGTSFPQEMLSGLKYIDLSVNEFVCTCDLMWFRDWIRKNKSVTLNNWPRGYKCRYPPNMNGKRLLEYNPTVESCTEPNPVIAIAMSILSIAVASVVIVSILYKSRWHIRYWIYLLRTKRDGYEAVELEDFTYDGFVVYCEDDKEWVHYKLIPKLEEDNGFNLCIHYRDFDIGKLIVDNIVECMDKSRKIIVVLSNAFTKSDWCQFELRLSQDRFLKANSRVLVLVMLEEINNRHLTSSLKAMITTTTYAIWTEEGIGQVQFWDQLITSLRK